MKLKKSNMNWENIEKKVRVGVAIADRQKRAQDVHKFNSEIEQIAYASARSTGQLEGFGQASDDLFDQLKTGELIPDQMFGWSTKTVFAVLLLLLLFKVKKQQGKA